MLLLFGSDDDEEVEEVTPPFFLAPSSPFCPVFILFVHPIKMMKLVAHRRTTDIAMMSPVMHIKLTNSSANDAMVE